MQKKLVYRHNETTAKTSTLSYSVIGKGKPVVLIHGFGEDSAVWQKSISILNKQYKLIIPDLPGSGASERLQKSKPSIANFAQCIEAILDKEKIKTCTMIGHSMGGYITASFVHQFPERIKAFGFYHSSAYADTKEKKTIREKSIGFIEKNGAASFLKTIIPDLFYNKTRSKEDIKALIKGGKNFTSEALIQYYHAMKTRPDRASVLKKATVPVLFILGRHDKTIPIETGLKQSLLAPETSIYILEKSAHMGMLEETLKATEYLEQFLQNI